jgi:hypothetical protein
MLTRVLAPKDTAAARDALHEIVDRATGKGQTEKGVRNQKGERLEKLVKKT